MSERSIEQKRAERLSAYDWAAAQMKTYFPKPDHYRLEKIDEAVVKINSHLSLFRGRKNDPVIIRTYWHDTDSVYYSIVDNYNDLRAQFKDYIKLLERTGIYVYKEAKKKKTKATVLLS